jgi:hypothetical protein
MKIVMTDELLDVLAEKYWKSPFFVTNTFEEYVGACVMIMEMDLMNSVTRFDKF